MKKFLRREWLNQEIPRQVYDRARERARKRLSSPVQPALGWVLAPAAVTLLALIWFVFPDQGVRPTEPDVPPLAQLPLDSSRPLIADPLPTVALLEAFQEVISAPDEAIVPQTNLETKPNFDRLVMNFVLPRSGVRMIWIKQSFDSVGGE